MSVISRLYNRFRQFGAFRIVIVYAHMGALGEFVKQGKYVLLKKKSINEAYSCIQGRVVPHLRKRYSPLVKELTQKYSHEKLIQTKSNKVWICWLQGMENAPEIVQICYASMKRHMTDREIIVITKENINRYVEFPEHIQRKYKEGKIPCAQFSDLLRLELLIRYGGTWIDSTVLCTGFRLQDSSTSEAAKPITSFKFLDADLFFFQFLKKGEAGSQGISNWFITASTNQKVLLILRDMLYQYWRDYNCLVAYFIFHIFFSMIAKELPGEIEKMPKMSNRYCFYLEHRLGDTYQEEWMRELTSRCCFHKLNRRLWNEAEGREMSYLEKIREEYRP